MTDFVDPLEEALDLDPVDNLEQGDARSHEHAIVFGRSGQ
jgi:hypothetical protein